MVRPFLDAFGGKQVQRASSECIRQAMPLILSKNRDYPPARLHKVTYACLWLKERFEELFQIRTIVDWSLLS